MFQRVNVTRCPHRDDSNDPIVVTKHLEFTGPGTVVRGATVSHRSTRQVRYSRDTNTRSVCRDERTTCVSGKPLSVAGICPVVLQKNIREPKEGPSWDILVHILGTIEAAV